MRRRHGTELSGHDTASLAGLRDALIEAGLLIAIIIAPLYFNPRTEHTFEPDKVALLRSVVLIAFLAWLIKREFGIRNSEFGFDRLRAPLVLPALLLLMVYFIGTAASVLPRVSLWGSYERGQGLYVAAAYVVLFFLARGVVRSHERRRRLIDVALLVSLPISVYAVLQHFGLDPLVFQTGGAAVTFRAISTLGNPIFLGAYLAMVIPLTILRVYQVSQPGARDRPNLGLVGIYGALLLFQFAAFFFAQSRGPTLGLMGGLGFGVLLWAARRRARRVVAAGAVVAILGIVVITTLPSLAPTTGLGRLGDLVDPTSRTGQQRLLVWEGTVNLATAEPARVWVGYGPETLREIVGPHLPIRIAQLKPDEDFDRAHNAVLDLWASTGLLGVAAYLLVIGAVLYYGLRILGLVAGPADRRLFLALTLAGTLLGAAIPWFGVGRQWIGVGLPLGLLGGVGVFVVWRGLTADRRPSRLTGDELLVIALLAAVVGHVVETLVGIAIVATYTLFWVYAALIAGLASDARETRRRGDKETRRRGTEEGSPGPPLSPSPPLPLSTWGLITGITLALFSWPLLTAGQARGGLAWGVIASVTLLFGLLRLLFDSVAADDFIWRYIGVAVGAVLAFVLVVWLPWPPLDITHSTVATFVYVVLAVPALAVTLFGVDPARASIRQWSGTRRLVYGVLAIAALAIIWLSNVEPIRADVFYKEGLGLSAAGNLQGTARALETSVALDPREDRYHSGAGAAYAQMAQMTQEPGVRENWLSEAEVHLQAAQRLDPYRADHARNLGVLYRLWAGFSPPGERTSRLGQALTYYERAAMQNPVSVRIWREWGEVYAASDQWDAAIQHYEESLRLNDGFVETWLLLARANLHTADYGAARRAYSRALALDQTRVVQERQAAAAGSPDDPLAHQALALVYAALGRNQAAMAEAAAARRLMTEEPPDWGQFLDALQ